MGQQQSENEITKAAQNEPLIRENKITALPDIYNSTHIEYLVSILKNDEQTRSMDNESLTSFLYRKLALTTELYHFERIYNTIFGSQITILNRLNQNNDGISTQLTKEYYENYVQQQFKDVFENYSFEKYIGFMIGNNLIFQDGDVFKITQFGIDFLILMIQQSKTDNRPF